MIEDNPQHESNPEEPNAIHHHEQPKGPAAVRLDVAGQRIAQGQDGEDHDQDGIEADTHVLHEVANGSTDPDQIKSSNAGRKNDQHVYAPIPAMKRWSVTAYLRNELQRPAGSDDRDEDEMRGHGEIARGVSGNEMVRRRGRRIPSHRSDAIDVSDVKSEDPLTDGGQQEPG